MRKYVLILGVGLFFASVVPASAQQFTATSPASTTNISSIFSRSMAKPGFASMSSRPAMPTPLSLGSLMPTLPNLQNNMLLRNIFGGPQTVLQYPKKQAPPPPKK